MNQLQARSRAKSAFSLLEIMIVIVIISLLMGVAIAMIGGASQTAEIVSTKGRLQAAQGSLNAFRALSGRYPTQAEGLKALVERPAGVSTWTRQGKDIPSDAWGNELKYRIPGTEGRSYDLWSTGPDIKDPSDDIYAEML